MRLLGIMPRTGWTPNQIINSGSVDQLKANLDKLAENFLSQWVGQGIDALDATIRIRC